MDELFLLSKVTVPECDEAAFAAEPENGSVTETAPFRPAIVTSDLGSVGIVTPTPRCVVFNASAPDVLAGTSAAASVSLRSTPAMAW
ncbi:MAG: hypothetical protein D8B44_06320 [Actinomyces sp.]|nr:MAG: hypothetical protein D8B44_06320 [Actinomyces sp.]